MTLEQTNIVCPVVEAKEERETEKAVQFTQVEEFELFDKEGNSLANRFKGIRKKDTTNENLFCVVSKDYKLVQHEEVYTGVTEGCEALGHTNTTIKTTELNNGGRLRINVEFNDYEFDVTSNDDYIKAVMTVDNSVDLSTGLRTQIIGYKRNVRVIFYDRAFMWYHKHTKGLEQKNYQKSITKAIQAFENKFKEKLVNYHTTNVNHSKVTSWLEAHVEKAEPVIPRKYLNAFLKEINVNTKTLWDVYEVFSTVLERDSNSLDVQERHLKKMDLLLSKDRKILA